MARMFVLEGLWGCDTSSHDACKARESCGAIVQTGDGALGQCVRLLPQQVPHVQQVDRA